MALLAGIGNGAELRRLGQGLHCTLKCIGVCSERGKKQITWTNLGLEHCRGDRPWDEALQLNRPSNSSPALSHSTTTQVGIRNAKT